MTDEGIAGSHDTTSVSRLSPRDILFVKRQQSYYLIVGSILLVFLLTLAVGGFFMTALNAEIAHIVESICASEPTLGCTKPPLEGQPKPSGDDQLKVTQSVHYADDQIYRDNQWFNRSSFYPFTSAQLATTYKCLDIQTHNYRSCIPSDYNNPAQARFDWSHTFEGAIYFARALKSYSDVRYGALAVYIFPSLYAMLGACAFGLRNFPETGVQSLLFPAAAVLSRLVLAALLGFIVRLFHGFSEKLALEPLAVAFLVGYSTDIFFSFLDTLIETIKAPSRRRR